MMRLNHLFLIIGLFLSATTLAQENLLPMQQLLRDVKEGRTRDGATNQAREGRLGKPAIIAELTWVSQGVAWPATGFIAVSSFAEAPGSAPGAGVDRRAN